MAQQDVRYYLNGTAARDRRQDAARGGHRRPSPGAVRDGARRRRRRPPSRSSCRARACWSCSASWAARANVELAIGTNHVRAQIGDIRFTSKLIDGRFPEYGRVIPASPPRIGRGRSRSSAPGPAAHRHSLEREVPRRAPDGCSPDLLTIQAHNPEQEEAEDQVEVVVQGRGSRDRLQRQLPAGRPERDRERQGRDRPDGLQQQLPDPCPGHDQHALRRDADAALTGAVPGTIVRPRIWQDRPPPVRHRSHATLVAIASPSCRLRVALDVGAPRRYRQGRTARRLARTDHARATASARAQRGRCPAVQQSGGRARGNCGRARLLRAVSRSLSAARWRRSRRSRAFAGPDGRCGACAVART